MAAPARLLTSRRPVQAALDNCLCIHTLLVLCEKGERRLTPMKIGSHDTGLSRKESLAVEKSRLLILSHSICRPRYSPTRSARYLVCTTARLSGLKMRLPRLHYTPGSFQMWKDTNILHIWHRASSPQTGATPGLSRSGAAGAAPPIADRNVCY